MKTDYWFFVTDEGQFKWGKFQAAMFPLDEAKLYIEDAIGKTVLDIGYGTEIPKGFQLLPEYQIKI